MSTNTEDESFHPLGAEWESELTSMLDDTEHDTELGLAMAEDAQRLVAGELTEAEFQEKYHEQVLDEFGEDERPTADAIEELEDEDGGLVDALTSLADGDQSRRDVMKKMGVGGAALGVGALADGRDRDANAPSSGGDTSGTQWGMTIDLEVCDGCLSCMQACGEENNLDEGVNWMYVMAYEDDTVGAPENPDEASVKDWPYLVRPCQHCTDAPCEKVCPTTARHTRSKDGIVLTDYDVCIGCRYCQVACPYGVNYFQWDEPDVSQDAIAEQHSDMTGDHIHDYRDRPVDSRSPRGVMSKCTFCPSRQDGYGGEDKVGTTACMDACPPGAIQFGDVNEDGSDPSVYADYPAFGRAVENFFNGPGGAAPASPLPSIDEIESELGTTGEATLDEAFDLFQIDFVQSSYFSVNGYELIGTIRAITIIADDIELSNDLDRNRSMAAAVEEARAYNDALVAAGIDFESTEVRRTLNLGEETFGDARSTLKSVFGDEASAFNLLEEVGTSPNVTYIGNEPGPHAQQIPAEEIPEGKNVTQYSDITYSRADGSDASVVDNRMDVIEEETVRGL
ncbi:Fe-S-cluster-containing hydrogenase subunit [Halovivax ruber XH-70]|uniref:Fe-S-cluster-containing hydrogenase subunit n=1 Tax=Halovivax ruber (strain DSM 18193 / JCM 13892 / XH-70) TaxID=797302 RepID=L0IBY8_HALRX|nr:4Fe-4S ferredoxin N-terminal domain-containing protein [Halovivax ruber]AGB15751.1 Fe-S-cluster-containing hydrogenase subunit [Halovivax ruber XH-70]